MPWGTRQSGGAMHRALALPILLGLILSACGRSDLPSVLRSEGVPPDAVVRVADDAAFAADARGNTVRVLYFSQDEAGAWTSQTVGSATRDQGTTVRLVTLGGETGLRWNTYVFGTASDEVSRVELEGFSESGGQVVDGSWVIVLPDRDVTPRDLNWRLVDSSGALIDSGRGITSSD